jgi:hypothetical protein
MPQGKPDRGTRSKASPEARQIQYLTGQLIIERHVWQSAGSSEAALFLHMACLLASSFNRKLQVLRPSKVFQANYGA